MPVTPARTAAFDILLRVEQEAAHASELLHSKANEQLSPQDHGLATELVMGVLRWRSRLDDEIKQASSQPLTRLDAEILIALRLALYQIRWLDQIPSRAAVNESVELVKRARKKSAVPFVNAVLRKLAASKSATRDNPNSIEEIATTYAHPKWLVERWARQFTLETAKKICEHNQSIPATSIRVRDTSAIEELKKEKITLRPGAILAAARRVDSGNAAKTQAFREGKIVIQDEASQLVAELLGKGKTILDCCAAPGGKTLATADNNPNATTLATELHPHRARLLKKLLQANQPSKQIQIITADARHLPFIQLFDRILADVPCSGTGTLSRNPEIKWRLTPADLADLQSRQQAILESALKQLAPNGRLIYSTCSLEKEENEDVIEKVLQKEISVRVVNCRSELDRLKSEGKLIWQKPESLLTGPYLRTIPGIQPCDGFFAAILEKI